MRLVQLATDNGGSVQGSQRGLAKLISVSTIRINQVLPELADEGRYG